MDREDQNSDLPQNGQTNKNQSTKYEQIIQNTSNYKLDASLNDISQEKRQLNIFQKKITNYQNVLKNGFQKRDRKLTLSPTYENNSQIKSKEENKQNQSLSMQVRPDLQELLSPLSYYFHKKELASPFGHYMKNISPEETPSKKSKNPFKISKREHKNQQIYENIYQTLKNQQSLNSKKQNKRNLFLNSKGSQMESFLNNSPLNLSVLSSIDQDQQKFQIQSTKSNTQENQNKPNYQVKHKFQIRAASSNNQSSYQEQALNQFQKLSTEITQNSPKNLSNSVIGQHPNKESFSTRKALSVFKHRQIYNQQLNKRDGLKNNEDLSVKPMKTLEAFDTPESYALKTINRDLIQTKLKTEDSVSLILNTRYQKEQIPQKQTERLNKEQLFQQQEVKIQDIQNPTKVKKQGQQQLKLDISLIQFDQQQIILSNNQSVKEKIKQENKQKEQIDSNFEQKNRTNKHFQTQESGKNLLLKKQILRHQNSFTINNIKNNNYASIDSYQKSNKSVLNTSQDANQVGKIQKEKLAKKYLKDIVEQNMSSKLQDYYQDDEMQIQNIISRYSYKKVFNQQKLRQLSQEMQKPSNRFLSIQQDDNPGPGEYNLPGMSDKYSIYKKPKNEKHHLNQELRLTLTPFKDNEKQLLVTNYFSPKIFNSIDNTIHIPHQYDKFKINHNNTISYN